MASRDSVGIRVVADVSIWELLGREDDDNVGTLYAFQCNGKSCFFMVCCMRSKPLAALQQTAKSLILTTPRLVWSIVGG